MSIRKLVTSEVMLLVWKSVSALLDGGANFIQHFFQVFVVSVVSEVNKI